MGLPDQAVMYPGRFAFTWLCSNRSRFLMTWLSELVRFSSQDRRSVPWIAPPSLIITNMQGKSEDSNLCKFQFVFCSRCLIPSDLTGGALRVEWHSVCGKALETETLCPCKSPLVSCSGYWCHLWPGWRHSLS